MDSLCRIQGSRDQHSFDSSPELIAVCHALHRLLAPRHPPHALSSLTALFPPFRSASPLPVRPENLVGYITNALRRWICNVRSLIRLSFSFILKLVQHHSSLHRPGCCLTRCLDATHLPQVVKDQRLPPVARPPHQRHFQ